MLQISVHVYCPRMRSIFEEDGGGLKFRLLFVLRVLKEMTIEPNQEQTTGKHSYRISKYPTLNYSSLYHSLINLIDIVPLIQTNDVEVAESIIDTLACLAPFLPYELLDALPYTFATTLTIFPVAVRRKTMDRLCNTLLPINMGEK